MEGRKILSVRPSVGYVSMGYVRRVEQARPPSMHWIVFSLADARVRRVRWGRLVVCVLPISCGEMTVPRAKTRRLERFGDADGT